ncbi:conjugative transposon protein TraM [Arcticibacter tournemirensis]
MKKQLSAEALRKRKFLLVLPLLILPFMTMAFWALGGGKGKVDRVKEDQRGFNTKLPEAKFSTAEKLDKFSIYEASARNDPKDYSFKTEAFDEIAGTNTSEGSVDDNEQRINEKLSQINSELSRRTSNQGSSKQKPSQSKASTGMSEDVDRLENLMKNMQTEGEDDPEMVQLNSVLEKILEIQHPGRTRERLEAETRSNSRGSYSVKVVGAGGETQSLVTLARSIDDKYASNAPKAIQATIHQDQEIISGSVVKLRLLDSVLVYTSLVPKNAFIYGIASIDGERLKITIATLRYRNSILPISLSAFDLDGLEGLYIPGAIARDASKKGVDDAIQGLQIMSVDPSISAQMAGAGVQAAKGLFGKKVKQVRVKVKTGYQLLLRDNNERH